MADITLTDCIDSKIETQEFLRPHLIKWIEGNSKQLVEEYAEAVSTRWPCLCIVLPICGEKPLSLGTREVHLEVKSYDFPACDTVFGSEYKQRIKETVEQEWYQLKGPMLFPSDSNKLVIHFVFGGDLYDPDAVEFYYPGYRMLGFEDTIVFECELSGTRMSPHPRQLDNTEIHLREIRRERESKQAKAKRKADEQQREDELYSWLRENGFEPERQVKTNYGHVLDLWLPGSFIIEMKAGRVSAGDVCQAMDYYATYKLPVILCGKGISGDANRGIEALTCVLGCGNIVFIPHVAIKSYVKSRVS